MSSIYDKASLVLIPSGTKTSKVYSQKPTNGDGDFTFSRSTAATRVNASGNIEKETQNLLLQSNAFTTTWTTSNAPNITSGQSGYDGTSDAWKIELTAAYGQIIQSISISGLNCTSIYAKAGTIDFIRLRIDGSPNSIVDFNLTDGSTAYTSGNVYATSTSVGGGWYRLSMVSNISSSTLRIYPLVAANDLSGTSGYIYIQDAQLEQGLVARDYIETTTAAVEGGITDNVPRLDYTDSSCPALLLEPQRTNYAAISEYFDHIDWAKSGSPSVVVNSERSPELLQNACTLTSTASGDRIQLSRQNLTGDVTYSIYAKSTGSYTKFRMRDSGSSNDARFHIDANGTITYDTGTNNGYTIKEHGDGWYRLSFTFTGAAGTSLMQLFPDFTNGGGSVYVYGAQMEQGSYATSYIPAYGSTATRVRDLATSPTNTFDSLSTFTWFFEISRLGFSSDSTSAALSLRDSSGAEQIRCHFDSPSEQIRLRDAVNGYANIGATLPVTENTNIKVCLVCNGITMKVFADGTQRGSDYTIVTQHDVDRLYLDGKGFDCSETIVFPTALTDQEAIDLTTL